MRSVVVSHDDESVNLARASLVLSEEELSRVRDDYYSGWRVRDLNRCGGPDTWPFYVIAVGTEVTRLAVLAAMPERTAAAIRVIPDL